METWNSVFGTLKLGRFPYDAEDRLLRAWNGADTLICEYMHSYSEGKTLNVLILNDSFGALTLASLRLGHSVCVQSDSALSRLACKKNAALNDIDLTNLIWIDSISPLDFSSWAPDLVIMQIPKSNVLLEFQIRRLASSLIPGTPVCAGAMTRDVHNSTIQLFATHIQNTTTSLASHKARLIHSIFSADQTTGSKKAQAQPEWPRIQPLEEPNLPSLNLVNHAGIFSASGHDQGSLMLLHYLAKTGDSLFQGENKKSNSSPCIIDCGCGNALLALVAARVFPQSTLVCADESFMAVESAREGFFLNGLSERAEFLWTDCLDGVKNESADLILCNPPFHQGMGQTQTLSIANRMFEDSRRCLKPSGKLLVVTNRHLGHHRHLEELFPRVSVVAENERFMVIEAQTE